MRFAISGMTQKGGRLRAKEICAFVRECKSGSFVYQLLSFPPFCGSNEIPPNL